jgi:GAF domain-containing protein
VGHATGDDFLRRRIQELELLRTIDLQLSRTLDPQSVLRAILDGAIEHLPRAYKGAILLKNSQALHTEVYLTADDQPFQTPLSLPLDGAKGITLWALTEKRSARVDNVRSHPWDEIYVEGDRQTVSELDVPLMVGDDVVGIINLESRQEGAFSQADQDFLETLAGRAALAVKNSQAYSALAQRRVHELEILRHIELQINKTLHLPTVLNAILEGAAQHMPATTYKGSIFLYEPSTNGLVTQRYFSNDSAYRQTLVIPLDQDKGIIRWAFKHKQTARVRNVVSDPEWKHLYLPVADDILAELDVPLMDGDDVVGIINFESRQEGAFSQADQDFLETLAGQAVLAIRSAQLYETQKQEAEDQKRLVDMIDRITNQEDTEQIFQPILARALELTQGEAGTLMLCDPQQDDLYVAAQLGVPAARDRRQQKTEGIIGQVARDRMAIRVSDVNLPPWKGVYFGFVPGIRSELAVPILEGKTVLGVLNVEHSKPDHFTERHRAHLEALAGLVRIVLQKVRAVQRLKDAEALSSIGRMRLELAHRLGNDLGRVRSYVSMIEREVEAHHVRSTVISDCLESIVRDVTKVMNLGTVLTVGDPTPGSTHAQAREMIGVEEMLSGWVAKLDSELPSSIRFEHEVVRDLGSVHVVRSQIHAIIEHLVLNAQQAMPSRGTLTLRGRPSGDDVAIQIQDTGVGISKQQLSHIFDLGYSDPKKRSTGYGLYAALSYAHDNDGELKVKSALGEGTTFTLLLPRARQVEGDRSATGDS